MDLGIYTPLTIDFHDRKYISVNAKQYDKKSRFILITCCNQGKFFFINSEYDAAYIRYRKSDDLGVFNRCNITDDGKILVELTEQMLAVVGICYADLVVLRKDSENNNINDVFNLSSSYENGVVTLQQSDFINIEDEDDDSILTVTVSNIGEIITSGKYSVLSTMTFCVNVGETAFDNIEIESSYEFNALNDLLTKSTDDYTSVMIACKMSEDSAYISEQNANVSEENAGISEANAKTSEINSKTSEENSKVSEINSKASEENAKASEESAKISETNAEIYANTAITKAEESSTSSIASAENAQIAIDKATESYNYAKSSKSYAVGETGSRIDEDIDNAKYYYAQTKVISNSIHGAFIPMGTIEFSELQSVLKDTGYMYHVSDSFITDNTFRCGAGISYPLGTNVYYTSDGHWDCIIGNFITYEDFNALNQTIAELLKRIEALEEQTVLEIVE